ncbi:hypothetical protein P4278_30255 [Bacillus thuringiensis]|nr:hypothetical protein [Bacillus thuringiensis]MED2783903.1 hypothetical protein [Bacillus thuringiensis]
MKTVVNLSIEELHKKQEKKYNSNISGEIQVLLLDLQKKNNSEI